MNVNVKGVWNCCRAVVPTMREQKSGSIINIESLAAIYGMPYAADYAASKAAVAGFTHNTALEYGPYGVRCNSVAPGWINTPFNERLLAQYPDREAVDTEIEALHPAGRLGVPEDVANTVFWLASSEASFITGQEIICDGGRLAKLPLPKL